MAAKGATMALQMLKAVGNTEAAAFPNEADWFFRVGIGTSTDGGIVGYDADMPEVEYSSTWTAADAAAGATLKNSGSSLVFTNGSGGTLAITTLCMFNATGGAASALLYYVNFTEIDVGDGGTLTAAVNAITITEV